MRVSAERVLIPRRVESHRDRGRERVSAGDQDELGVEQGQLGKTGVEVGSIVGQGSARGGLLEGLAVEPGAVAGRPLAPVAVCPAVAEEELAEPVAGTQAVLPQVAPG